MTEFVVLAFLDGTPSGNLIHFADENFSLDQLKQKFRKEFDIPSNSPISLTFKYKESWFKLKAPKDLKFARAGGKTEMEVRATLGEENCTIGTGDGDAGVLRNTPPRLMNIPENCTIGIGDGGVLRNTPPRPRLMNIPENCTIGIGDGGGLRNTPPRLMNIPENCTIGTGDGSVLRNTPPRLMNIPENCTIGTRSPFNKQTPGSVHRTSPAAFSVSTHNATPVKTSNIEAFSLDNQQQQQKLSPSRRQLSLVLNDPNIVVKEYDRELFEQVEVSKTRAEWAEYARTVSGFGDLSFNTKILDGMNDPNVVVESAGVTNYVAERAAAGPSNSVRNFKAQQYSDAW